jgi:hypothetical protein
MNAKDLECCTHAYTITHPIAQALVGLGSINHGHLSSFSLSLRRTKHLLLFRKDQILLI